jgi:hypothetical protein
MITATSWRALALGTVVLAAASAPVGAADRPKRDCFRAHDVNGYTVVDDRTVDVSVGANRVYRLTLFSDAHDIDFGHTIAIESRGGLSICSGLDATIIVPSTIGPRRYPVTEVRRLSKEEIAARKAAATDKPKAE